MATQTLEAEDPALKKSGFELDTTVEVALDLKRYGGMDGLWRFTYLELKSGGKELLIEFVDAPSGAVDAKTKEARRKRFDSFGFKFAGYSGPECEALLEAVNLVPDAALEIVRGMKFARDRDKPDDDEAGHYASDTHTVTILDKAFATTLLGYDRPGAGFSNHAVRIILHEIGHAIDLAPVRKAVDAFNKHNSEETQTGLNTAVSQSGRRASGAKGPAPPKPDFLKATEADGRAISVRGEKDKGESYAEAFSLFISDPDTLKVLRPKTHKYLVDLYGAR
jgi:hypothetical protein